MILGNLRSRIATLPKSVVCIFAVLVASIIIPQTAMAVIVSTEVTSYWPGDLMLITGAEYSSSELVTLTVTRGDGSTVDSWQVSSDDLGSYLTSWSIPLTESYGDSLLITSYGNSSGQTATTSVMLPTKSLNQLHNGTTSSSPEWANGNINSSNSCYSEGLAVPLRFGIKDVTAGSSHFFTIQSEATKGGIHAYDYFVEYDLTEADPIDSTGGPCGTINTAVPVGCVDPTGSYPFPAPDVASNYDFLPGNMTKIAAGGFDLDGPQAINFYNAVVDSMSKYSFTGTSSDRELNVTVYFHVVDSGDVGFYWAGHLAEGTPSTWGLDSGSASVGGAPYHMRAINFDGGGAGNQDRSIQGTTICLPPSTVISCTALDSVCVGDTSTCSIVDSATSSYSWSITGGNIVGSSTTSSVTYEVTGAIGTYVVLTVEACNDNSGCNSAACCATGIDSVYIGNCPDCEVFVSCPSDTTISCDESSDPASTGTATYTSTGPCTSISVTYSDSETAGSCPQEKTITRTWIVSDASGPADTCVQTINVVDNTAPSFVEPCPADATVECSAIPTAETLTATDNCDPAPIVIFSESSAAGACPQEETITRIWIATDACGNADTCTQVLTVEDTTPPSFVEPCPTAITVECDAIPTAEILTATDSCDPAPIVTFSESTVPGACAGQETITRIWIATDACGNADTCTQVLTVEDTTPPIFLDSCPASITVECDAIPDAEILTGADSCDPAPVVTFSESSVPGACAQEETITRQWIITDCSGNADTCTQTINVVDTTPPIFTFTCPNDTTIECNSPIPQIDNVPPQAVDNCNLTVDVVFTADTIPGSCPQSLIITNTWVATDDCGNDTTCSYTITIVDTTPPSFVEACPNDTTVECSSVPVAATLTATDICDANPTVGPPTEDTTLLACGFSILRTWTASDACNNTTTCQQTVTVVDITPPTCESVPDDITVECTDIPSVGTVTAIDDCDPNPQVTYLGESEVAGSCIGEKTLTRSWEIIDYCGNADTCTQTITVIDTTPPVCSDIADTTIVLCDSATICLPVSGDDACSGAATCSVLSGPGSVVGGQWCYLALGSETVNVTIECTDDCGNSCQRSFTVTFTVNVAPILTIDDGTARVCSAGETICVKMDVLDPDNGLHYDEPTIGWVLADDTVVCFIVGDTSGLYCNTVTVYDSCGLSDTESYCVSVTICDPPALEDGYSIEFGFLCDSITGCIDPPAITGGCGPFSWTLNGNVFDPNDPICYHLSIGSQSWRNYRYVITDSCGRVDSSLITVHGKVNSPPYVVAYGDTVTVCADSQVCATYWASDSDLNITSETLLSGPPGAVIDVIANTVCFVPGTSGTYDFTIQVTDSCGVTAIDTASVLVEIITPVTLGNSNLSAFICGCTDLCAPLPEVLSGTPVLWTAVGGTIVGDSVVCILACNDGLDTVVVTATDACGNEATGLVVFNLTLNSPPTVTLVCPDTLTICTFPETICCIIEELSDPDNNIVSITSTLGTVDTIIGSVCFEVTEGGTYENTITVTDECGAVTSNTYTIVINADPECGPCPNITIEKAHYAFQGQFNNITISIDNLNYEIGGYDLLIKYDASALVFSYAEPGQMILDCGWEYFTYRYGANGNCGGSGCPTGIVRLVAIAETNNGANHPNCFGMTSGDLAYLTFLVTDDRTFECQYVPIRFIWYDCGDNALSDKSGDTLYISREVYDFNIVDPITDLNGLFPSYTGANVTCNIALEDGKPDPIRCIEFYNGGIDIVCADSIDARGDINLNDIANEIADAVLFSNYFVHGLSVFNLNLEGQIAASDVNADGLSLSVADLVYLIRIVVGDALPYAKLSPSATSYTYDGEQLSVADQMGAVSMAVQGSQRPELLVDNMELLYSYDTEIDITRILVFSMERGETFSGEFLSVNGTLTMIEFATYEGAMVEAKLIPNQFALYQNHPNPFNPTTTISFELGRQSHYELVIYNITGQKVAAFSGDHGAGMVEVQWDAQEVASGIYFYRLTAGEFTAVKKMIMLK